MNPSPNWRSVVFSGGLVCGLLAAPLARAAAPLTADEIMTRAVERAESPAATTSRPDYTYRKHTVTDELSGKGDFKDRKEKIYEVSVVSGLSSLKLLQVNGKKLTPQELKKQEQREAAERAKLTDSPENAKASQRENVLTSEIAARYSFSLVETTTLNSRPCYAITFKPKTPAAAEKKLLDRFLNQMAGTVWIDSEDFEIAKAQVHLCSEVELWGGVAGKLKRCDYTLVRTRLSDGNWFNSFSHGVFEGRKVLEPMYIRTMAESSDFRKIESQAR
jgi:hypothetical protein